MACARVSELAVRATRLGGCRSCKCFGLTACANIPEEVVSGQERSRADGCRMPRAREGQRSPPEEEAKCEASSNVTLL